MIMKYFHPHDTREAVERFKLTRAWFDALTQENENLRRKNKPERFPQTILDKLKPQIEDPEFIGQTAYRTRLSELLNTQELTRFQERLFDDAGYITIENLVLRFNFFRKMEKKDDKEKKEPAKYHVQNIPDMYLSKETQDILASIRQRQHLVMGGHAERCPIRKIQGKLDWRMVIGLGGEHIQETSMTLHHVYGIPYIPGSAVKGMVRHYFISQILEPECRSHIASFSNESFERLLKEFAENAPLLNSLFPLNDTRRECDLRALSEAQRQQLGERLCARLEHYRLKERLDILDNILSTPNLEEMLNKKDIQQLQQEWKVVLKDSQKKEHPSFEPRKETVQKCLNNWPNLMLGQRVFGTQKQRGTVQFFDAYPVDHVKFDIDVMNSHYPDYYDESKHASPHDSQNPNPIPFLTVADTTFTFYVGYNPPDKSQLSNIENRNLCLDAVTSWLKNALQDQGIGAKSAVGYGYFQDIVDQTDTF